MKQTLKKRVLPVLLAVLMTAACTAAVFAYTLPIRPGDLYEGACPVCGGYEATFMDIADQPTCTTGAMAIVACHTVPGMS